MIFRHPNCHHHTYPKTERLRYSLTFSHNSYSYPLILLVLYSRQNSSKESSSTPALHDDTSLL